MTADISPFLVVFPPVLVVFLPCVHPQPEARLLQIGNTRSSNHRHSGCINDLEAILTASYPPIFPVLRPFYLVSCRVPALCTPSTGGAPASNWEHTCTQSQTLRLYQRLGGYFDCQLSAHFPGSSSFLLGFLPCSCPVYTLNRRRACLKLRPHVHPITDTQAVSTTWRLF